MLTATAALLAQTLLPEFDHELVLTRRVLERAPEAHFNWQPHPKSMTLTQLATHTADMPGYMVSTLETPALHLSSTDTDWTPAATIAELLQRLEKGTAAARTALEATDDEAFAQQWTMYYDGHPVINQPRAEVVRHIINHMIHHRAQIMVYLRLLDVPVPGIYGPSADER
ncbi:DinB family protein [Hymenobacter cavernae]|nr:DinB family protein [Hymenobacter cavernae]